MSHKTDSEPTAFSISKWRNYAIGFLCFFGTNRGLNTAVCLEDQEDDNAAVQVLNIIIEANVLPQSDNSQTTASLNIEVLPVFAAAQSETTIPSGYQTPYADVPDETFIPRLKQNSSKARRIKT